jgi:hypothetical protein
LKAVIARSPNNAPWSEQDPGASDGTVAQDPGASDGTVAHNVLGKAIGSGKYTFYQVRKST